MDQRTNVTQLLDRLRKDPSVASELLPAVYQELRAMAASFMAGRGGHTLQPTAIVHEAYMKLVHNPDNRWESRDHFFSVAAKAMRQVLADHARSSGRLKRGGAVHHEGGTAAEETPAPLQVDYAELDEALHRLAELNPRHAQVVELRFFAGLSVEDCARFLQVSPRTIEQDWKMARAFLRQVLRDGTVT
jgi:RNA polymerase sigma-70 factor (ECF subfamily)